MGRARGAFPPVPRVHGRKVEVWWQGRWHYLGAAEDAEGWRREYAKRVSLWSADPEAVPLDPDEYLVAGLVRDYLASRDAPTEARQRERIARTAALLAEWAPGLAVAEFGPNEFRAWQTWLCGLITPAGGTRYNATSIRHFRDTVKRIWKWGCSTTRLPAERWQALRAVPPPRFAEVRAARRVQPARPEDVERTLPHLPEAVRACVQLLRLTGARPTEILTLRPCDLDRSGEAWVYRPDKHKGTWRGKVREVILPPAAREVLAPWLEGADPTAYLFRPDRCQRGELQPRYNHRSLGLAVRRACKRAGVPPWSPYRLRHLKGAEVRASHGLEAVRAVLGHSYKAMSDQYSQAADRELAERVAKGK